MLANKLMPAGRLIFSLFLFVSTELTEKDYDGQSAIYWEVKYPFPLSNRDVSYRNLFQFLSQYPC